MENFPPVRSKKSDKLRKRENKIYLGAKTFIVKELISGEENSVTSAPKKWNIPKEAWKIVGKSLSRRKVFSFKFYIFLWRVKFRKSFKIANEQRFHFQDTIFRQNLNFPMDCDYSKLFYKRKYLHLGWLITPFVGHQSSAEVSRVHFLCFVDKRRLAKNTRNCPQVADNEIVAARLPSRDNIRLAFVLK